MEKMNPAEAFYQAHAAAAGEYEQIVKSVFKRLIFLLLRL
jgi:hypothetical protein